MNINRVLEIPLVYRISQSDLALVSVRIISGHLSRTFKQIPAPATVLDVGCGPSCFLWNFGMKPVGLDVCRAYTKKFRDAGNLSVTASAAVLPFPTASFDLVFSANPLHHLPDDMAGETIGEILRITRPGGNAVLSDAVLPRRRGGVRRHGRPANSVEADSFARRATTKPEFWARGNTRPFDSDIPTRAQKVCWPFCPRVVEVTVLKWEFTWRRGSAQYR